MMSNLSPAIPITEIIARFEACEFSLRDVRSLLHDSGFPEKQYKNHQLCFLDSWCKKILGRHLSISQLA
jgi:hypothetical protein